MVWHAAAKCNTMQDGDLADSGVEITQGKTYSTTRRLDSLVILSEEDNLLEEFSTLSSDAEKIHNSMFEVENEATDIDRETNTEEMVDELLEEVIDNIPDQKVDQTNTEDNDQTKLTDLSSPKPACTQKVSFCAAENAKTNSEPEGPSCTKTSVFCDSEAQPCTEDTSARCTKTEVFHNHGYPDLTQNIPPDNTSATQTHTAENWRTW